MKTTLRWHGAADHVEFDGFEVTCVTSGATALAVVKSFRWTLVVLDLMLPDTNGFDVFGALHPAGGTPTIMLSALPLPTAATSTAATSCDICLR